MSILDKISHLLARSLALLLLLFPLLQAEAQVRDRIGSVKEADPVVVSGKVGTHLGMSYNSLQPHSTPFTSTLYANLNLSFYSFDLPFSFYLTNNTTSFDYPQLPTLSLGFTPTWDRFKLHVGSSSMHFSNYTYSGLQFLGLGAEYQGGIFRAAAFGGLLNQATRLKGYDDRTAFQRLRDSLLGLNVPEGSLPQYRRNAYGVKLGLGNERNFIDFSMLKAEDAEQTLPEEWRDSIRQKENLALGLSSRLSLGKLLTFTANLGASLYTDNKQEALLDFGEESRKIFEKLEPLYGFRSSSILRFAGDAALYLNTRVFNGSLSYRFIQPDYVSLGAGYFSQNSQSIGASGNIRLFKGRSNLSLIGYGQQDNLNRQQMYTNRVTTYTLNWSDNPCDWFSFNAAYNGILQQMGNGTCIAPDSIRTDQVAHTLNLSPVFTIARENTHDIALNFNYIKNANRNRNYYIPMDIQTFSVGIGYDITLEALKLGLNTGYDYGQTRAELSNCNTHSFSYGCRYSILSEETTDLSVSFNGAVGYNIQLDEGAGNNFSVSNSLGGSFSHNKKHNASLYLSLSNYSDNVIIGKRIATDLDLRLTFSYAYSFGKEIVKRKSQEQKLAKKAAKLEKKNRK
ncbi:MAG: hypothetical protein J6S82_00660 [Bacteroidales bacterium]|nr:hypothetical protein [Bacteroidales bacterium]